MECVQVILSWRSLEGGWLQRVVSRRLSTTGSLQTVITGTDWSAAAVLAGKHWVRQAQATGAGQNRRAAQHLRTQIGQSADTVMLPWLTCCRMLPGTQCCRSVLCLRLFDWVDEVVSWSPRYFEPAGQVCDLFVETSASKVRVLMAWIAGACMPDHLILLAEKSL